jgi:prolyl 3-hydroxylase /prolyl 3,4-dihydroxylase
MRPNAKSFCLLLFWVCESHLGNLVSKHKNPYVMTATKQDESFTNGNSDHISTESDVEEPAAQRQRTDVHWADLIQSAIVTGKEQLKSDYTQSRPYPHGIFKNIFEPEFLKSVLTEVKCNSQVNFKESDLFRVYQSIDLANVAIEDHSNQEKLPNTIQLRQFLYSDGWRHLIEDVSGLERGTLNEKVDCAFNCHTTGCHLLCHDDVIGTRKISYILYLTDEGWKEEEGGALELYDSVEYGKGEAKQRLPNCVPSKTILPLFNHMGFFEVRPGFSFHAVQEVFGDRPRLSLQGWYHTDKPPKDIGKATLERLKATSDHFESPFTPVEIPPHSLMSATTDVCILFNEDLNFLRKYVHPVYLNPDAIREINQRFEEDSSVQLRNFLLPHWVDKLRKATEEEKQESSDGYTAGVTKDWKLVGPSHKQRYLQYTNRISDDSADLVETGEILAHLQHVLQSSVFLRFLLSITSLSPTSYRGHVRRFRPGLDYTVAHYGLLQLTSVLDATLCFVAGQGEDVAETDDPLEADVAWQSGDVGAFECYIAADDEEGSEAAADEYHEDDDTGLLSVSASNNTLSLVYRDPGTLRFIKYVGSQAPSSRWDISMEYQVTEEAGDCANIEVEKKSIGLNKKI